MRTIQSSVMVAAVLLLGVSLLQAEPGNFGVNGVHHHKKNAILAPQKAIKAFKQTVAAIALLHEGKSTEAITKLQQADTLFTAILKKKPKLNQIPISQEITVVTLNENSKQIERSLALAEKLLKQKHTQSA